MTSIDLDLFAVMWNQMQNQTTPAVHLRILRWLEHCWITGQKRMLLMAFRACGKSTLVGIFCAWLIYRDPNHRILVVAADDSLARKMVRNVKRILEKHPLTSTLKPDSADQWANDRFTVLRGRELRDPTMLARGITSNFTGSRADIIIYDDVEVPNTSATAEARVELRNRLDESRFILAPKGTQLYVGTPHTYDTIYRVHAEGESAAFLADFESLCVPILDDQNRSAWPDRFPESDIAALKKQVGPNKFASQMMLQLVNSAEGRLDIEKLRFYADDLEYNEVMQKPVLHLRGKRIVSCSSYWDPSYGSARGDASVWAVIFTDEDGTYTLHHIDYIRTNAADRDDEATQQCKKIAALCARFYVPSVMIETNGIGKFLPSILRREMHAMGVHCAITPCTNSVAKSTRILEAFDAILAAENLWVHENVKATPFLTEMREWRPTMKNASDDGLDAVAGALLQEPVRIAPGTQKGTRKNWSPTANIFKAKT